MKALITGANGFLGSAVLRLLVSEGYDVCVLVRPNADKRNLEKFDLKIIEGDLQNTESLKRAVDSCDQVFHVAADYRLWVPDPEQMYKKLSTPVVWLLWERTKMVVPQMKRHLHHLKI